MRYEQPEIKNLSERLVACVSFVGNYIGNTALFAELFGKLGKWAGSKGLITPESVFLSSYQGDPRFDPPEELSLDVCMSIPDGIEVEGEIQKKVLPGGLNAVMHAELTGAEEYGPVWETLCKWTDENNYEIDMSRPGYEIYLNNPEEHPEKLNIIDICLPLKERV